MTTDQQVRLLMSLIKRGVPLATAAAKAGMSERTGRKYKRLGALPSDARVPHSWRTRADPFETVWSEVEELLEGDGALQAKTVFEELRRRYPGRFSAGQLRTLQRRFRHWRALYGPAKEVYFAQRHCPGEQCQSDFTAMGSLGVMIAGAPFPHLLYHFVLTYSNWEWVSVFYTESFEALSEGLQGALWRLGGVPQEHRTDNLSAATHELKRSRGRGFTERYRALLAHYGVRASKNTPGRAHENGDVESAHGGLKNLVSWGSDSGAAAPESGARTYRRHGGVSGCSHHSRVRGSSWGGVRCLLPGPSLGGLGSVTGHVELEDHGMVHHPIDCRRGGHGVFEDLVPF